MRPHLTVVGVVETTLWVVAAALLPPRWVWIGIGCSVGLGLAWVGLLFLITRLHAIGGRAPEAGSDEPSRRP